MCRCRPEATTCRGHMRGSTLLLHRSIVKPLILTKPTPKRPSPAFDYRPSTIYRLAAISGRLLLFITAGNTDSLSDCSIAEMNRSCKRNCPRVLADGIHCFARRCAPTANRRNKLDSTFYRNKSSISNLCLCCNLLPIM
jgi:hypothetical protein